MSDKPPVYCSFCDKSSNQVQAIVAGAKANICDECVDLCMEICSERRRARRDAIQLLEIARKGT